MISVGARRSGSLHRKFAREVVEAGLPSMALPRAAVVAADLLALPPTVQRYLRFMNVVGEPAHGSLRLRSTGVFRLGPDRPWLRCEAWQFDTSLDVARIFLMQVRIGGVVPVLVRDTYVRGRGRMCARVLDLVDLVDESDEKIAVGELVTYLNDALIFAPSMLIGSDVCWTHVSEDAFDVALTDRGRTVRGRALIDGRGALVDFSTTDRYVADPDHPGPLVRARWSTPIEAWRIVDGRPTPGSGSAVWHLPSGDFCYARFAFDDPELDVAPSGEKVQRTSSNATMEASPDTP